jgi:hypothetical protein
MSNDIVGLWTLSCGKRALSEWDDPEVAAAELAARVPGVPADMNRWERVEIPTPDATPPQSAVPLGPRASPSI